MFQDAFRQVSRLCCCSGHANLVFWEARDQEELVAALTNSTCCLEAFLLPFSVCPMMSGGAGEVLCGKEGMNSGPMKYPSVLASTQGSLELSVE